MKGDLAKQVAAFLAWREWTPAQIAADIARRVGGAGVTRQDIEHLLKKPVDSPRYIAALAAAIGTSVETLVRNGYVVPSAPYGTNSNPPVPVRDSANVQDAQSIKRLPIISWVQAGQLEEVQESGPISDWATLFDPDRTVGGQAFALRVSGDSMTSPVPGAWPNFPEGTILIVDPDAGYDPGDYVIAKDVETQKANFKRLVLDGGRWYLKPLNPAYPTLQIDQPSLRVIGKVVEFQIRGRL